MKHSFYSLVCMGALSLFACQPEQSSAPLALKNEQLPHLPIDTLKKAIVIEQAKLSDEQAALYKQADLLKDNSIKFLWHKEEIVPKAQNNIGFQVNDTTLLYNLQNINVNSSVCYSINVTDINGCNTTSNFSATNGSSVISPSGGTQPYTYAWSRSQQKTATMEGLVSIESAESLLNQEDKSSSENEFKAAAMVSTLSIDVDNAAYSLIRTKLSQETFPEAEDIRIEELINYFDYDYPQPTDEHPFSITTEIGPSPWNTNHHLIHVGIQGKNLKNTEMKPSNLVFLIDVSGSMDEENKLPLLKKSFELLLNKLSGQDKVSIVVYAGAAGLVLKPTYASNKKAIVEAIEELEAGGSTAGGEGIELAYKIAKENFIKDGNNRVILATDGDFNVGISSDEALVKLIEEKRKTGIFLTICGFGMGDYQDNKMEQISNAGNGNYFYIDNLVEAKKVFVKEMRANMFAIAKDVKIQVEFNPQFILAYRLIGYENRLLAQEDFNNDAKDAGELGAGHSVTAIYEVVLAKNVLGNLPKSKPVDFSNGSLMAIKFRYKPIDSEKSILMEHQLKNNIIQDINQTSDNFRFSAAVVAFGMQLRNSNFKGNASYDMAAYYAKSALGKDVDGYRAEFLRMIKSAKKMQVDIGKKAEE